MIFPEVRLLTLNKTIMKQVNVKLYRFSELSEEAQQKVIDRERQYVGDFLTSFYAKEREETLEKFCDIFGIVKVKKWEVREGWHRYNLEFTSWPFTTYHNVGIDPDEVCGKYLMRYMRDLMKDFYEWKFFSTHFHTDENGKLTYKKRHSKITLVEDCCLTGVCYDCDILSPIWDWYRKPDYKISLYDLVDSCLYSFFRAWEQDIEYSYSDEGVREDLLANECDEEYCEDGSVFRGIVNVA